MKRKRVYLVYYHTEINYGGILVDIFSNERAAADCGWNHVNNNRKYNPNGWYEAVPMEVKDVYTGKVFTP